MSEKNLSEDQIREIIFSLNGSKEELPDDYDLKFCLFCKISRKIYHLTMSKIFIDEEDDEIDLTSVKTVEELTDKIFEVADVKLHHKWEIIE